MSIKQNLLMAKLKNELKNNKDIKSMSELLKYCSIYKSTYYRTVDKDSQRHKDLLKMIYDRHFETTQMIDYTTVWILGIATAGIVLITFIAYYFGNN